MKKINVKHPIFIYVYSFIWVMKILEFESADLLLNVTFSISIISLIYVLIRLNKTRKKYSNLVN